MPMPPRGKRLALLLATFVVAILALATWLSWPYLRFWWRFEPMGVNAQGLPEYRHRQTGIVMVRVPGGTFWMGAQKDDPNGPNYDPDAQRRDGPVHEVELSPFLIAKYEVTQAQWECVMGSNSSFIRDADLPVDGVSWHDCFEFCRKTGLALPTEAQWEYACRAGTVGPFAGTGRLDDMGWYMDNSDDRIHSGGQKQQNGFGLHDTHGNLWEWCEDVWDETSYAHPLARRLDPVGRSGSGRRVIRGGSWVSDTWLCRSAFRDGMHTTDSGAFVGFRQAFYPLP